MNGQDFKEIQRLLKLEFEKILKEKCFTDFIVIKDHATTGQVFVINLFYGEEYINNEGKAIKDVNIVRPILEFQCKGHWSNRSFDINSFFNIDNEIFSEFYELSNRGILDTLVPILFKGASMAKPQNIAQVEVYTYLFLDLSSITIGADMFQTKILEEGIATIGLDDTGKKIDVSCMLCERKKIILSQNELSIELFVPFDKVSNFDNKEIEIPQKDEDDRYIFVIMSFENDLFLKDVYQAIKRSTGNMKKGYICQRVDEIQDDFIITDKIIECIKKAGLVIVDITGDRPNVYYELGYARALGKKIILLARQGVKPHFDVTTQNIIFYESTSMLEQKLKNRLRALLNKK